MGSDEARIEVHLYGKLSQRLSEQALRHKRVLTIEARPDETFGTLLARLGLRPEDLYTVFLNGSLLVTRNGMAPWLRYQQAQEDVWNWDQRRRTESRRSDRALRRRYGSARRLKLGPTPRSMHSAGASRS